MPLPQHFKLYTPFTMTEPLPTPIPDLPEQLGDHDCPICFEPNAITDRIAVCPNGHRLCADCQPRIQSVPSIWQNRAVFSACPLCRAPIPYIEPPRPVIPPREPRPARVQDPDGRRGDPERPQRAIDGFNNLPARRAAQARFRQFRDEGAIPANARFGGIHTRSCPCGRRGGAQGVRFLKLPDGSRKYRCEVCYGALTNGGIPEEPPAWSWNGAALAAHNET